MERKNFDIIAGSTGDHVVVRLLGTRDEARAHEFLQDFLQIYPAQPIRSLLIDLTRAEFPDPLSSFVGRFSAIANMCPRSKVALLAHNVCHPAVILLAQTIRGACHEVVLTEDEDAAMDFLRPSHRYDRRECRLHQEAGAPAR